MEHARKKETTGFPTTCLCNCNKITTAQRHWPSLSLDGRRRSKSCAADLLQYVGWEAYRLECLKRVRNIMALNTAAMQRTELGYGKES